MHQLVLVRHGESEWNKSNLFTGWTDVDLSEKGVMEAKEAGQLLKREKFEFDIGFTSYLKRAIKTLDYILDEMNLLWIPIHKTWHLNERHYGALQGLSKETTARQYGEEQVMKWRRSYDVLPPALTAEDERNPRNDPKYRDVPERFLPLTESLKETGIRVEDYWEKEIVPQIKSGKKVIVAAHGNSLRALIKYLENISNEAIVDVNIPTGTPLVYSLDEHLKPVEKHYLGSEGRTSTKIEKAANPDRILE
ncbi:2,3-diphosphoglycerate-dependent phosphoglycerate mutase [Paenibacillus macerans]|uniref:2,3-diphosphoglycerate-dependent phosphoglycerate mutase n=1 Tax=Paenibacillus macerans TaxID=44252 RepID=UPI000EE16EBF|nr:2,3-diphosphoglycerate-dependent phosphoglycerate mutase [Paenibacillus macerans]MEC0139889.1 2,3-diphosphoglycerate-dependent phosphoglycerate mutase [Paenibacillus macerans]GBK63302.1 2,3-diphosphoglycerate-dependent phosphoglycerate mutase [Paenibacillus macerans]GBK69615.1 2,3-diphosphoglycerate-dependent phosphoglycerate mutase [Paenibacillus macerans]